MNGVGHRLGPGGIVVASLWLTACACSEDKAASGGPLAPGPVPLCTHDDDCSNGQTCEPGLRECVPDCRAPERMCLLSSVCQDPGGGFACVAEGPVPTCMGTPEGQVVPFVPAQDDAPDGPVLHWVMEHGCIPITYQSNLTAFDKSVLEHAVSSWEALNCARLCFDGPEPSDDLVDLSRGERRVHFATSPTLPAELLFDGSLFVRPQSGEITGAIVWLSEALGPRNSVPHSRIIGWLLGLGANDSPASILSTAGLPPSQPTFRDREALCLLYGDPPYCE